MTDNLNLFKTVTAEDIFNAYSQYLREEGKTAELGTAKTALVRFTVPGWSNVYPSGAKCTTDQMTQGLAFLSQVTAQQFKEALSVQEAVFEHLQIEKSHRRRNRSPLNKMVAWAETQGYFDSNKPEGKTAQTEGEVPFRLNAPRGQARQRAKDIRLRSTLKREDYALGSRPGDYVNSALQEQLNDWVAYLSKKNRPPTIEKDLKQIQRLLGWLHREKGIPLETLSLENVVHFSPVKPRVEDYLKTRGKDKGIVDRQRYADAKFTFEETAKGLADKTVERIKEYLTWRGNHPGTDAIASTAVINVAKFLYRHETEEKKTFGDIIVIKELRELQNGHSELRKSTPQAIPHSEKSIPWQDALKVLRAVQREADLRTGISRGRPLAETTIARHIQRLLILLLFMASPPDRSRTIRELEVGRTLMFGQEINGKFTPAARVKNPDEAEWLLHLLPADTKTGNTYGESWDRLPDTPEGFLADGKTLYSYLDLWLNQYRAVFKPDHNCLLTKEEGKPLDAQSMYDRVREVFFKHTGVPVTPKELRKMYVTYLKDLGATEAELEAAAARMRHSRKMQSEDYDQQERSKKVAPVQDFHKRTMMAVFKDDQQKGA
jgi:hypothetical protein